MGTVFRYALAGLRWQILGWGLAMFLLAALLVARHDLMVGSKEEFKKLLDSPIGKVVEYFGDKETMFTTEGFLNLQLFSFLPLVLGIFVILNGSGLLAVDEEKGTLDLILAHPVSRSALFGGRLLAFGAATLGIVALSWLGVLVASTRSTLEINGVDLALPYLSFLAVLLVFGTLALLLSMVLPSRRTAAMTAGLVLVTSFFLDMLARNDPDMVTFARLLPLHYFQAGKAMRGLDLGPFAGLLVVAVLFAGLAWWRFERRDIRVGGEGSWRLPFFRRKVPS
jgi:ABC-2 type transport system permease protein